MKWASLWLDLQMVLVTLVRSTANELLIDVHIFIRYSISIIQFISCCCFVGIDWLTATISFTAVTFRKTCDILKLLKVKASPSAQVQ